MPKSRTQLAAIRAPTADVAREAGHAPQSPLQSDPCQARHPRRQLCRSSLSRRGRRLHFNKFIFAKG